MLSGYVVKQEGTESAPRCTLTLVSHIDLKGNIPSWLINQLGTDAPMKMLKAISKLAEAEFMKQEATKASPSFSAPV